MLRSPQVERKTLSGRWLLTVFAVAFLVRFLMIGVWYFSGHGEWLSPDTYVHHQVAINLIEGKGFSWEGAPPSRRGPVYPLFIVPFLKLGWFPLGVQASQAFLGALSCLLLFGIGSILFSERVGKLAALFLSFDYLWIKQTVYILPEVVYIFFFLLSFYFFFRSPKGVRWCFFAGVSAGLTVLTKESLFLYFPLAALTLFLKDDTWKRAAFKGFIFVFTLALTIFPWTLRNRLIYHRWIPLTINAGHAFYLGNNPGVKSVVFGGDWIYGVDPGFPVDDPAMPPAMTPEADRYLMKKGLEYAFRYPRHFFKMTAIKALRLWFPYYSRSPVPIRWITAFFFFLVMILGLWGMAATRHRWKDFSAVYLLIVYITLLHSITIPAIRYRYPLMPFMMVFAAFQALRIWDQLTPAKKLNP